MWGESFWSWLRQHGAAGVGGLDVSPADVEELNRAAMRVASEFALSAPEVIVATAGRLLRRQVPASALRGTALAPGLGELQFADGTVITVRAEHPGELGRLAVRLMHGRVMLDGCVASADGVTLELVHDDRRVRLRAVGVAQPT
ncbi:MAG: hypothetical protein AAGC63_14465 [Propionicimonas sp.]